MYFFFTASCLFYASQVNKSIWSVCTWTADRISWIFFDFILHPTPTTRAWRQRKPAPVVMHKDEPCGNENI